MNRKALLEFKTVLMNSLSRRYFNSNIAAVTKVHRETYTRTYPTTVVLADGSSINIRYHEPRKIIKLPLDLATLSEEERKSRVEKRKPKRKVKITDDIEDDFNAKKYLKFMKSLDKKNDDDGRETQKRINIEKMEDSTLKQSENKDIVAGRLQNILNSLSKCKIDKDNLTQTHDENVKELRKAHERHHELIINEKKISVSK